MDNLKGDIQKIIEDMTRDGRVKTLTAEAGAKLSRSLSEGFRKAKKAGDDIQRASWAAIRRQELGLPSPEKQIDKVKSAIRKFFGR